MIRRVLGAIKRRVKRLFAGSTTRGQPFKAVSSTEDYSKVKMYITFEEPLPQDLAELAARRAERAIPNFVLDRKMVKRQDLNIANAVHAFFRSTDTYHHIDAATIADLVGEFREIYLASPITINRYGANFPSAVNLFLMARCMSPTILVESGVYKGQSSYVLASACPRAPVHSFDPNLTELAYRTPGAVYYEHDWMEADVKCVPVGKGFCFFDDHQSQAVRIIQAHRRGFRHILFDDSWPIEAVGGCGWPPLPSVDMVMNNPMEPGESVRWIEPGKVWTFVNDEEVRQLSSRARRLIKAAYEVPTLFRESGIAPTSAYKFVELVD